MSTRTEKLEALVMELIRLSEQQDAIQKQIDALKLELANGKEKAE